MFYVFLLSFRSVLVRKTAISSSESSERHFSWLSSLVNNNWDAAPGNELDRWYIAHAASFSNQYTIDQHVFKSIYHRIDGLLFASSKFGQRQLVMKN